MSIKDIIIIILIIFLIGAVLFGSLGNFLGIISGFITGVRDSVNNNEGYVYKGGYISEDSQNYLTGSDSQSSSGSSLGASADSVEDSSSQSEYNSQSSSGRSLGSSSDSSEGSSSQSEGGSSSDSSDRNYEDYQKDYETDMVDSEGNPIMLSIISTSGGQMEPGIYQVYWSSAGPINQTRIG